MGCNGDYSDDRTFLNPGLLEGRLPAGGGRTGLTFGELLVLIAFLILNVFKDLFQDFEP